MNNCIVCGRESDALLDDICPDCHMEIWRQSLIGAGDRVVLRVVNDELRADGLHLGQTGTVRYLEGKLGVEFDGYSDTGWNAGLQVIKFNTRGDDGKIRPILALCEVILPGQDPNKGIVARPGKSF